jgi:hypothetical protein
VETVPIHLGMKEAASRTPFYEAPRVVYGPF